MANYQQEFPDFAAADLPAIPQGFEDSSWHNDACPSFISAELGLRIWINYADKEKREQQGDSRFGLQVENTDDDITDPVNSDDWAVILEAVEEERAEITACLAELAKAGGAALNWQLDNRKFEVMLKRGLIGDDGDLYVHPKARKVSEVAYRMEPAKDMRVLFKDDTIGPAIMMLSKLISNFNATDSWQYRASEQDMRDELESRGWYDGLRDGGHYLVVAIDKMRLEPHPDHPRNELEQGAAK